MKNKRGFTLIELILVITLIGIFLIIIFSPFIFTLRQFENQNKKANEISGARSTMDYLTREIRKANPEMIKLNNNRLKLGSDIYILEDRKLFKNDIKVREGIDEIDLKKNNNKIIIKITIEDYKLSSELNLRTREGE